MEHDNQIHNISWGPSNDDNQNEERKKLKSSLKHKSSFSLKLDIKNSYKNNIEISEKFFITSTSSIITKLN